MPSCGFGVIELLPDVSRDTLCAEYSWMQHVVNYEAFI